MAKSSERDKPIRTGWTVVSSVLLFNGEPSMDLHTVTRAHCTFNRTYGIVLRSKDKRTVVNFRSSADFSQKGPKILFALQRAAPQVQVHMRGGPIAAAVSILFGLASFGLGLYFLLAKLFSETKYGWEVLPVVAFLAGLGAIFIWLYHPWHPQRFHATPDRAGNAIKQAGWRAFYRRYD